MIRQRQEQVEFWHFTQNGKTLIAIDYDKMCLCVYVY